MILSRLILHTETLSLAESVGKYKEILLFFPFFSFILILWESSDNFISIFVTRQNCFANNMHTHIAITNHLFDSIYIYICTNVSLLPLCLSVSVCLSPSLPPLPPSLPPPPSLSIVSFFVFAFLTSLISPGLLTASLSWKRYWHALQSNPRR